MINTIKYALALSLFVGTLSGLTQGYAWAWRPTTNGTHNYDVNCGNVSCTVTVELRSASNAFAPTQIYWQHKVNNPTGPYPPLIPGGTTYVFSFNRNPATTYYVLNVRSVSKNGVTESKHDFALNDFYAPATLKNSVNLKAR